MEEMRDVEYHLAPAEWVPVWHKCSLSSRKRDENLTDIASNLFYITQMTTGAANFEVFNSAVSRQSYHYCDVFVIENGYFL